MKNKLLLLSLLFVISFGHLQSQDYEYDWQPDSGSIFGNPWKINFVNKFVAIGRDLAPNVFDLDDAWLRLNGGLWHKANAIYEPGASHPYQIQLVAPEFLAKTDTSFVQLRIREVSGNEYVYAQALYFYSSPQLDVTKVNGVDYNPEVPLTLSSDISVFQIELHAYALFGAESQPEESFGSARIKRIEFANNAEFNDPDVIILNEEYNAEVAFNLLDYFSLDEGSLHFGHNTIYFRAVGVGDDHSSITELPIFIFDFEVNDAYCKYDTLIPLQGQPKGGRFSGECIVDNTMMFNPSLAEGNSTEVKYEYRLGDYVFDTIKEIALYNPPEFEIIGPQQVCGYEYGAEYFVEPLEDGMSVDWMVSDEAIDYRITPGNLLQVDWGGEGNGWVKAYVESEGGCRVSETNYVYIENRTSPKDSASLILNDYLLVCLDTNVKSYYWFHAGESNVDNSDDIYLGKTQGKNYFSLTGTSYFNNLTPSDTFFVETSYYKDSCCLTHSHFSVKEGTQKGLIHENQMLNIAPNPSSGIFNIYLGDHQEEKIIVHVYKPEGQLIWHNTFQENMNALPVDLGGFEDGIYIILINTTKNHFYCKVVLAK
ncbi:MAG: T9SS type A sorting domain-containing protein [Bacteroidales bacterium]|nr:T9SS type A sorting domain-containing protein [Bacteroidales bacterium]MCF8345546.1 T9SS type A sorting domain-containing protein [Bacteroidales bacterium]MCF8352401.1 T9SS type A sorting domain-containing protein [Bacteroidales bacterium]MCF8376130.1 T9SS type A sorting domain-containing protein [Bacteroidales bacterium]